jgi:hypothetical protein
MLESAVISHPSHAFTLANRPTDSHPSVRYLAGTILRTAIGAVSLRTAGCAGAAAGEDTVIVDPFPR